MTEPEYLAELQSAASKLIKDEIDLERFEELCKKAVVLYRGPPPEGREYVAAVVEGRLIVGHKAIEPEQQPMGLAFPWMKKP